MADRRALEKRAKQELEADGYIVERAWLEASYLAGGRAIPKRRDFFGSFDLIAARDGEVRLVQVTSTEEAKGKDPAGKLGSHRRNIDKRFPVDLPVEIWFYRKRNGRWDRDIYLRTRVDGGFEWVLVDGQQQIGSRRSAHFTK